MSPTMSDRLSTSRGLGSGPRWALVLLASVCGVSACISDVAIPPCVRDHSCASGGDPGDGLNPGASASGGSLSAARGPGDSGGSGGFPVPGAAGAGDADAGGGSGPADAGGEGGGGSCERCVIQPAELVPPCAGQPYSATLDVDGGIAPYAWQLTPALAGWLIAAVPGQRSRAVLTADPAAAGDTTLTVRAVDSRGLEVRLTYRTRARDACWFAYTAQGTNGPALSLVDALTEPAQPATLANNSGVYDFQFSPDGRYLAYRYGADAQFPHGRHLALVELSSLEERTLPFVEDAVTAYAWSPDAKVLAVGFLANGVELLGGVRLPALGSHDSPTVLATVSAFVEDNLAWVGNAAVAYQAELLPDLQNVGQFLANPYHVRTPLYARLGAAGFDTPQFTQDSFDPDVFLRPARDGFWIINSLTTFFPMTGSPVDSVIHYGATLVAPSGNYSALLNGDTLQLFAATDGIRDARASSRPGEACPMPLAWSQQDRVACVADVANSTGLGSHGEVSFFDLKDGSEWLTRSNLGGYCTDDVSSAGSASCASLRQGYGYGIGDATGAPRGFSASGRWFAFMRDTGQGSYLYWADLLADPLVLSGALFMNQARGPARLAFAPDSLRLGLQVGTTLSIMPLSGVSSATVLTDELATVDKCSEELPSAPDRYCGNTALDAWFKWAPDSKALAYRSNGAVSVVDTSHAALFTTFLLPEGLCEAPLCGGGFEFQPTIQH